ncbi:MtrB/PioB family outer membrane beta-barrel protein, partial [Acidobacteriota bacterium]
MRSKKILITAILIAFTLPLTFSLYAEESDQSFSGTFRIGYRLVDTSGTYEKYKEDFNLDDGVRLFNLNLHYTPQGDLKKLVDRFDLNVYNFGGDPFETFGLSIKKKNTYRFQYNRRKSTYFYSDQRQEGGHLFDLHTFNFDRESDSGSLKVYLGDKINLYMNFDRYSKEGESITTFDINRVEFEFDKPIKQESKEVAIGLDVHLNRFSFLFEEKILEYESTNSLFLPGAADGGPSARYPSALNYFNLNQPYDIESNTHTFKFNARPFNSLLVSGSAQLSNQDTNISLLDESDGTDYFGRSFTIDNSGNGSFERDIKLYDLDISLLLSNKLALIGAVRRHTFDQTGSFTVNNEAESQEFEFETTGFEGGLQYQISSDFALTLGYRNETRKLENLETVTYEEETQRDGIFGNLKLNLSKVIKITLDLQTGSIVDPYTLAG